MKVSKRIKQLIEKVQADALKVLANPNLSSTTWEDVGVGGLPKNTGLPYNP